MHLIVGVPSQLDRGGGHAGGIGGAPRDLGDRRAHLLGGRRDGLHVVRDLFGVLGREVRLVERHARVGAQTLADVIEP